MATKKKAAAAKTVSIYALCCPDSGEVRYIGKANDPAQRMKSHLRDARRRVTPVYCWINKMLTSGKTPTMRTLFTVASEHWAEEERRLIAEHRIDGRLLNLADGGDEPLCARSTRASNGRKVSALVHESPERKHIWVLKRDMGGALKWLAANGRTDTLERVKLKLRLAAQKRPDLFGAWAGV